MLRGSDWIEVLIALATWWGLIGAALAFRLMLPLRDTRAGQALLWLFACLFLSLLWLVAVETAAFFPAFSPDLVRWSAARPARALVHRSLLAVAIWSFLWITWLKRARA